MTRYVSDILNIMRRGLGRRNENDPDSNDEILLEYLNDAASITMTNDVQVFQNFGTLSFNIDTTNDTGVYTFNDVGADKRFNTISMEALISLFAPFEESVSWNRLKIYQDPGRFFDYWGINNEEVLIAGFPTEMLYYGNEFTFRTIPNDTYIVKIYGYTINEEFSTNGDPEIPYDEWLRYLAYLAMYNYAQDFRYASEQKAMIKEGYQRERKLLMTKTHNQIKHSRALPRF